MKKHYLILVVSFFILSISCKKDQLNRLNKSLIGSWELRKEIGGQIAGAPDTFSPGNGNIIQFTDKNYAYLSGTTLLYSGSYVTGVKGSGRDKEYTLTFIDNGSPRFFKIEDTILTIYNMPQIPDGSTLIYEFVKDPISQLK